MLCVCGLPQALEDAFGVSDGIMTADRTACFVFDGGKDLTGFIDGTRNPLFLSVIEDTVNCGLYESGQHTGGSYMYVGKFVHDLPAFKALETHEKSKLIGRKHREQRTLQKTTTKDNNNTGPTTIAFVPLAGRHYGRLQDNSKARFDQRPSNPMMENPPANAHIQKVRVGLQRGGLVGRLTLRGLVVYVFFFMLLFCYLIQW